MPADVNQIELKLALSGQSVKKAVDAALRQLSRLREATAQSGRPQANVAALQKIAALEDQILEKLRQQGIHRKTAEEMQALLEVTESERAHHSERLVDYMKLEQKEGQKISRLQSKTADQKAKGLTEVSVRMRHIMMQMEALESKGVVPEEHLERASAQYQKLAQSINKVANARQTAFRRGQMFERQRLMWTEGIADTYSINLQLGRVLEDLNFGIMGIANNLPMLFDQIRKNVDALKALRTEGKEVVPLGRQIWKGFLDPRANMLIWTSLASGVMMFLTASTPLRRGFDAFIASVKGGNKELGELSKNLKKLRKDTTGVWEAYAGAHDISKAATKDLQALDETLTMHIELLERTIKAAKRLPELNVFRMAPQMTPLTAEERATIQRAIALQKETIDRLGDVKSLQKDVVQELNERRGREDAITDQVQWQLDFLEEQGKKLADILKLDGKRAELEARIARLMQDPVQWLKDLAKARELLFEIEETEASRLEDRMDKLVREMQLRRQDYEKKIKELKDTLAAEELIEAQKKQARSDWLYDMHQIWRLERERNIELIETNNAIREQRRQVAALARERQRLADYLGVGLGRELATTIREHEREIEQLNDERAALQEQITVLSAQLEIEGDRSRAAQLAGEIEEQRIQLLGKSIEAQTAQIQFTEEHSKAVWDAAKAWEKYRKSLYDTEEAIEEMHEELGETDVEKLGEFERQRAEIQAATRLEQALISNDERIKIEAQLANDLFMLDREEAEKRVELQDKYQDLSLLSAEEYQMALTELEAYYEAKRATLRKEAKLVLQGDSKDTWKDTIKIFEDMTSSLGKYFSDSYDAWETMRMRQLAREGKTRSEAIKIIEAEGEKRIRVQMRIAQMEAAIQAALAAVYAFKNIMAMKQLGPYALPLAIGAATAIGLAGIAMFRKIAATAGPAPSFGGGATDVAGSYGYSARISPTYGSSYVSVAPAASKAPQAAVVDTVVVEMSNQMSADISKRGDTYIQRRRR